MTKEATPDAANAVATAIASKAMYVGGGTTAVGAFTSTDILAYVGTVVAVLGFIVNWYYKHQDAKRKERWYASHRPPTSSPPDTL